MTPSFVEPSPTVPGSGDAMPTPTPTTAVVEGMHDVEPDFAESGVWVEQRLRIRLPAGLSGAASLTGLHFPDLIAAQNGSGSVVVRVLLDGTELRAATLVAAGRFDIDFDVPSGDDGERALVLLSSACFVPARIQESQDQRELCWRLQKLRVGGMALIDCARPLNILIGPSPAALQAAPDDAVSGEPVPDIRFHLDTPTTGESALRSEEFQVSGWCFDFLSFEPSSVRVVVDDQTHSTRSVDRPDVVKAFAVEKLPSAIGFTVTIRPRLGRLPIRIDVLDGDGFWVPYRHGVVLAAGARSVRPAPRTAGLFGRVLPRLLPARPAARPGPAAGDPTALPGPVDWKLHLDQPRTDRMLVVGTELLVSGWAFSEGDVASLPVRVVAGSRTFLAESKQRSDVQKVFAHIAGLPLYTGFSRVVRLPIGLHRVRLEAQGKDGTWVPMRQFQVLRRPDPFGEDTEAPQLTLRAYQKRERAFRQLEMSETRQHIEVMLDKPLFTVIVDAGASPQALNETLRSIRAQVYPRYTIHVLRRAAAQARLAWLEGVKRLDGPCLPTDQGEYVVILRGGQTLSPQALYAFANAVNQDPGVDLVYGDETTEPADSSDPTPFYKPDWSPDYLETFNYIGAISCVRSRLAAACIDDVQALRPYDFMLRVTEATGRIRHVARLLGHDGTRLDTGSPQDPAVSAKDDRSAIEDRLKRTGRRGTVVEHPTHRGCHAIAIDLRHTPLVSIIIPTAGKTIELNGRRIDLVTNIVDQIRHQSSYDNLEIVIVDNGDLEMGQLAALDDARCRRVTYDEPVFNISQKLNLGASIAQGELLLLMNDDIEILDARWIERMVAHFEKPHVGVVGGKLLYPDMKLQHVGVVHNTGNPDHARRLYDREDRGYFFSTCGVRNYGAVTGACMMTPARVYERVGGYSEELAVSYNDADFCLKVRETGLMVVYAPEVELIHMESQSRVASADLKEVIWYQIRWAASIISDPFYNERFLTVAPPSFEPRVNERLV